MGEAGVRLAALTAGLAAALSTACAPMLGTGDEGEPPASEQAVAADATADQTAQVENAGGCDAQAYAEFIGQSFEATRASPVLPKRVRFICDGCLSTGDYVADRLNLFLDADGRVARLTCG